MSAQPFSISVFITSPLHTLAYFMLILSTLSFWVYHRIWLWGPLVIVSLVLGFIAKILTLPFLIPLIFLAITHYILKTKVKGLGRLLTALIATLLSAALCFHILPDVHNWLLASQVTVSPGAQAINYYWNFDKPFIAFFVLGFHLHVIRSREDFKRVYIKTLIFTACTLVLFIIGAFSI